MKTLYFNKSDVQKGYLILVNPSHPLETGIPEEHLSPVSPDSDYVLLERQASKMLAKAAASVDCQAQVKPVSGFRTLKEQQGIYLESLIENGEAFTQKYVAIPGCSEHQTGLAIDLAAGGREIDFIRPDFPYTGIYGQFREASVQYGFIERYPAGREAITKIAHEPWHFRYVGYPHSKIMTENALTLEEYIDYVKRFSLSEEPLCFSQGTNEIEISFVPVSSGEKTSAEIPEGALYQWSGNNEDGIIMTLWRNHQ